MQLYVYVADIYYAGREPPCGVTLALFPGIPFIQFLIACSMQKRRGNAWSILSHEDISGRQRGEGSLIKRAYFAYAFFTLNQEWYLFCFVNVQNFSAWGRNYKIRPLARSFDGRPSLPLFTLTSFRFCIQ